MSNTSKPQAPKISPIGNEDKDEFKTKVFVKSGYPKTWKENIKLFLNLFVNFFS